MIANDELLFVVNEDNKPIQPKPRDEVHKNGYWHRTTHVWIVNSKHQILCQKRTVKKDMYPGMWDPKFGGHLKQSEKYLTNAQREIAEELRLQREKDLLFFEIYKCGKDKEFQAIYWIEWNGDLKDISLEKEEVAEIAWRDINELENIFRNNDPQWIQQGYELRFLSKLKERNF